RSLDRGFGRRSDVFRERMKLELDEQCTQPLLVRLDDSHPVEIEIYVDVISNRDECFAEPSEIRLSLEGFARPLLGDLVSMCENVVQWAVGANQLLRRLLADAAHTWHVVRRVANEREIVG